SVNALGADFIMAQQGGGVAATAKHFPRLGAAATSQDTDVEPVTLNLPASEIRSIDEEPYKAAISAGVKLVWRRGRSTRRWTGAVRPDCRRSSCRASCASGSDSGA